MLSQPHPDGEWRPVSSFSKATAPAVCNSEIHDKEYPLCHNGGLNFKAMDKLVGLRGSHNSASPSWTALKSGYHRQHSLAESRMCRPSGWSPNSASYTCSTTVCSDKTLDSWENPPSPRHRPPSTTNRTAESLDVLRAQAQTGTNGQRRQANT